ncbi:Oidioi.mRNA.OKI2018_I69.XSR.g14834.t1.cds [Oikopleura dioica]|uniref:Oidioi.mRNA.OKI2018_I69.XSR.g14834.t1.cds n=1 Tax=Oikopleura dioica TaxID=34765 RepID=A0ABN7SIA3_OIKDI|nr:Oidioi.mRNA.OKI2018_I69.XSR.g14834.t1.cds [Oikopleura dioica]
MVVNPRQYALYHIKRKQLSNFEEVLPTVFAYCDEIQESFDFLYDFSGRKRARVIRLEDLEANELSVVSELYKFAGYKWRGVNAQDLQKWAEHYQLEPNEWRTTLPFDLVDTIDNYCRKTMDQIGYLPVRNDFILTDLHIDLNGENYIDQTIQNLK